ncbi:hypothetical protein B0H17DRAFT_1197938 [Mycena rosella]|uniref:Transcription factor domain-containing protein n=1 Tax=Mycena rosella TaxID=1033263 RepID=A0AAD7GIH4_MYCRO|nr:hypothetical protein B0H17DRAFT_1197938 [Mycena rosella]
MARVEPGLERVSKGLDSHVNHVLLPAILLQDLRSVEIAQSLMMLAAFQCPNKDIREDRSWTLLVHAIRVASELNLQGSLFVKCTEQGEAECRRRRNAERTWINLWLHEFSLAQHTGRRSLLADQGLFPACREWYLEPHACHSDLVLVAMVELRTIVLQNRQLYKQLPKESTSYYVEHCKSDLKAWSRAWVSASKSMPRLELATLYVNHALIQLLGLALHNTPGAEWNPDIILDLYQACLNYLEAFPNLLAPAKLVYCYNSMFVAATYEAAVAIRLANLAAKFGFIDVATICSLCGRVSSCLDQAAATTTTIDTAARSYARFLTCILQLPPSRQQSSQPEVPPFTFDTESSLGFESLEMFAWAGALSAQQDDLLAELFRWQ